MAIRHDRGGRRKTAKTIYLREQTKADFDALKATVAETMTADEFLRVLMLAYRNQREEVKALMEERID